ncbi:MAG TPA: molybdopterin cofactor-binding domain-containing protein, partial [Verrucomicrobiae bacterium]|nr:molybdopterin cofactor-binding domain-containing protein [Verrucomicrobiae bacterium]
RGSGETNTTHYGQDIQDNRIQTIWRELKNSSRFDARRLELAQWNRAHSHAKRGIAITPVKFGISFTVTHLNQAGALVLIYQDGTVQINHGGTEMGQGLHTNVRAIASRALGVPPERVRLMPTSTDKIPNTSATAASSGTDLNGAAVQNACEILRERLRPIASALLNQLSAIGHQPSAIGDLPSGQAAGPATEPNIPPQDVSKPTPNQLSPVGNRLSAPDPQPQPAANAAHNLIFQNDTVFDPSRPEISISFSDLVRRAYLERISLSATGFYATPGIHWNRETGRGNPFHYFAYGAAVTEVEIDAFTGMHSVTRVDILHDVGDSINPGVNRGQIEGGFVQGMGWLTTEELKWDPAGRLLTHSPDTYKLPAIGDAPQIFNVAFLSGAAQKDVVHGSKAVGEPPLMLAISVREAIRDAVAAFGPAGCEIPLASPATCEAIFAAIQNQRRDSSNPVEVDASPLHNSATCEAAGRQAGAPGPRQPA